MTHDMTGARHQYGTDRRDFSRQCSQCFGWHVECWICRKPWVGNDHDKTHTRVHLIRAFLLVHLWEIAMVIVPSIYAACVIIGMLQR